MPTALLLHAHPDDEVFANFGWASDLAAQGYEVHGAIATAGEASELRFASSLAEARSRRLAKYETVLEMIGASGWSWLDGAAGWVDADCGPTVAEAAPERLRLAVERLFSELEPDIVLTVGSDGLTRHPDHIAIAEAAAAATNGDAVRSGIWGAQLAEADVHAGADLLHAVAPDAQIGSGRVAGTRAQVMTKHVRGSAASRQRALDVYREGLGTGSLEELMHGAGEVGDSVLLRGIFEVTGWSVERYGTVRPEHAQRRL